MESLGIAVYSVPRSLRGGRVTEGKVAFCFPGQGSQEVGMGRAMSEAFPAARDVYERAAEATGLDIAALCFEGPIERLSETDITQPALVTTELACLAGLTAAGLTPDYVVGHSVGEYAALAAAGSIDDRTAAHLTRERGLATAAAAAATPGAMAAVIGLDDAEVERLCDGIEGVWAANYNCPGQVVVSGTLEGVAAFMTAAESGRGASRGQAQGLRRLPQPAHRAGRRSPGPGARGDDVRGAVRALLLHRHAGSRVRGTSSRSSCSSSRRPCGSRRPSGRCATWARARSSRSGRAACSRA